MVQWEGLLIGCDQKAPYLGLNFSLEQAAAAAHQDQNGQKGQQGLQDMRDRQEQPVGGAGIGKNRVQGTGEGVPKAGKGLAHGGKSHKTHLPKRELRGGEGSSPPRLF